MAKKYTYMGIPGSGPADCLCHQCRHRVRLAPLSLRYICGKVAERYGRDRAGVIGPERACNYYEEPLPDPIGDTLPHIERLALSGVLSKGS